MIIEVVFWGVRGSIPTPGVEFSKFGGNTSCVEIIIDDNIIILDMGSGLKNLGQNIFDRRKKNFDILLSHFHYDHTCGLPFFIPAYDTKSYFSIRSAITKTRGNTKEVLKSQMSRPSFPITIDEFKANISYRDFPLGVDFRLGKNINVKSIGLNHPDGATGYRIEAFKKSICYITDHEHIIGKNDIHLEEFVKNSDVLIYDSTYDDEDFSNYVGWGHSTWQAGRRLAKKGNVRKYIIFHHNPDNNDTFMEELKLRTQDKDDKVIIAKEGMKLEV